MQFTSVGSMCCHSLQACIGRFRECHTMCQIHEQLSWATNVQLNFGSTPNHAFLKCLRRGVARLLVCVQPAAMVTHDGKHGTLAFVNVPEDYVELARLRHRAIELWRKARRGVRWYLRLRRKWWAIGKYLGQVKPALGPIPNSHVPKLKKKYAGHSTSSR